MEWTQFLLSGGVFTVLGILIKEAYDRNFKKATTGKITEETVGQQIANQSAQTKQIKDQNELLSQLLEDAKKKTDLARELGEGLDKTRKENFDLKSELDGKDFVINYQKEERHEWMVMLKTALDGAAEQKQEIAQLKIIQKEHTRQIDECTERDNEKGELIKNFETRLNVLVGMLQKANLPLPEGFIWSNIVEQEKVHIEHR